MTTTEPEAKLVWLDLETSCLDPNDDHAEILEVAVVITEENLEPVTELQWVIGDCDLDVKHWDPGTVEMHSSNGLLAACVKAGHAWKDVRKSLERVILNANHGSVQPLLAGNTVHFDRAWLNAFAPEILTRVSHRHLDVSSIYEMLKRSQHATAAEMLKSQETTHRAMPDICQSMDLYEEFRLLMGLKPR